MRGIFILNVIVQSLFCIQAVRAQENVVIITPEEAVQIAMSQNQQVALAKRDEQISASQFKQTEAIFLPQVNFSYSAYSTNNPLYAFGFKLQQQGIEASDFNPEKLNHPSGTPDFTTQFSLQQSILDMNSVYQRKSASKQTEVYQFKTQRTRAYVNWQVEQACLQIKLAYDAVEVTETGLQAAQGLLRFTNDRYDQGFLQKSDLLQASVQVKNMESAMLEAKNNIMNASDYLGLLLNKPPGTIYKISGIQSLHQGAGNDTLPSSRADFKAMEAAIQSYDLMVKGSKMSYLPRLNAFGNYQLNDKTMFGFSASSWFVGMQLSWDIFKGNQTRNKIKTQVLERNKLNDQLNLQKEESQVEMNKAKRQYEIAGEKIVSQESAVEFANESLRILEDRYKQGLVNTTDVLVAQNSLSQQKMGFIQAVYSRDMALSYLRFLTTSAN